MYAGEEVLFVQEAVPISRAEAALRYRARAPTATRIDPWGSIANRHPPPLLQGGPIVGAWPRPPQLPAVGRRPSPHPPPNRKPPFPSPLPIPEEFTPSESSFFLP